ncbi:hypothetical protein LSH36_106g00048 [Paralvinella palmiformis]|uniref:SAC3/GANP/THP3 conserved domain-containing protein n=1 Tax=Paralvinella palmiformis TaxID=53620 RepID=A0AAD9N9G0_9ANNE|nr:hypothetical protein LSH36_106g00048 [Paralvinella palmiformis]
MNISEETRKPIIGLCQTMCPEREIKLRESEKLLHWLELKGGRKSREHRADRRLVIKEYLRPAAGKYGPKPAELRPGPVLLKTTSHLIKKKFSARHFESFEVLKVAASICFTKDYVYIVHKPNSVVPLSEHQWHEVYGFVFDRLRAVRQDMTIQQIQDSCGVRILEHATRIMIFANYRLCQEPLTNFDPNINATHIQESLKKLLNLYEDASNCRCNMAEFVSIYLLFNLCSTEALQYGLTVKKSLKQSLHIMCSAYNNKALSVPVKEISSILQLNNEEHTKSLLELCGLEVIPGKGVRFMKASFQSDVLMPRTLHDSVEEDLQWEDISRLLLGNDCQCLTSDDT